MLNLMGSAGASLGFSGTGSWLPAKGRGSSTLGLDGATDEEEVPASAAVGSGAAAVGATSTALGGVVGAIGGGGSRTVPVDVVAVVVGAGEAGNVGAPLLVGEVRAFVGVNGVARRFRLDLTTSAGIGPTDCFVGDDAGLYCGGDAGGGGGGRPAFPAVGVIGLARGGAAPAVLDDNGEDLFFIGWNSDAVGLSFETCSSEGGAGGGAEEGACCC